MCGPEGYAEGQCDDRGVDGPRAVNRHLRRKHKDTLRPLADGQHSHHHCCPDSPAVPAHTLDILLWLQPLIIQDAKPYPTHTQTNEKQEAMHTDKRNERRTGKTCTHHQSHLNGEEHSRPLSSRPTSCSHTLRAAELCRLQCAQGFDKVLSVIYFQMTLANQ